MCRAAASVALQTLTPSGFAAGCLSVTCLWPLSGWITHYHNSDRAAAPVLEMVTHPIPSSPLSPKPPRYDTAAYMKTHKKEKKAVQFKLKHSQVSTKQDFWRHPLQQVADSQIVWGRHWTGRSLKSCQNHFCWEFHHIRGFIILLRGPCYGNAVASGPSWLLSETGGRNFLNGAPYNDNYHLAILSFLWASPPINRNYILWNELWRML